MKKRRYVVLTLAIIMMLLFVSTDTWASDNKKKDDGVTNQPTNITTTITNTNLPKNTQIQNYTPTNTNTQTQTYTPTNTNTQTQTNAPVNSYTPTNTNTLNNTPVTTNTLTNNPTTTNTLTNAPVTINEATNGDVTVTSTSTANSASASGVTIEAQEKGSFRQFPETVQPTFPALKDGGKSSNGMVLNYDKFIWLPKYITKNLISVNNPDSCSIRPKVVVDRKWHTGHIAYFHEGRVPNKNSIGFGRTLELNEFEIIGYVFGDCPNGDTMDMHLRASEAGMKMGGDVITYLQTGKGETPTAWSAGIFGGGVAATLGGGEDKSRSISVSGGLGFNYGKASINEYPGAIAVILELKDFSLARPAPKE